MRTLTIAIAIALGAVPFARRGAAEESSMNAGQLANALDRLSTTTRVLYIAAHPDDENTRLLTHLANERHLVVAYLSMTRGGGGQNLIGLEQGELLDVIRTEELLAARSLDGAVQFFTRMRDFGYSKRASETLEKWGHDEALADVVRVIRTFQPDVVISRFDEKPPNHGHHTASATLAREAFAAAGDPAKFPEQKLAAWKPIRLLHNLSPWRNPEVPADALTLDVGSYDPRLGMSHGELAAVSRSQHKSQGFGVAGERGSLVERFAHVAGAPAKADILEGAPAPWSAYGAKGLAYLKAITRARAALERDAPEKAAPALLDAYALLNEIPADVRVRDARVELQRVVTSALGVFVRATAPRPGGIPGSEIDLQVELVARATSDVSVERVSFPGGVEKTVAAPLVRNEKTLVTQRVTIPADMPVSVPYWLAREPEPGRYTVPDPALIGTPRDGAALHATVELRIAKKPFVVVTPVVHAWTDRVHGERIRPFLVIPPATVTPARESALSTNGKPAPVLLRVRAGADAITGSVTLDAGKGWRATPAAIPVQLDRAGDETTVRFEVTAEPGAAAAEARPSFVMGERAWSFREDLIDYPHIPVQLVLQPASLRLVPVTLVAPKGLVGYVVGSGDSLPDDLQHAGVKVELLDDATLRSGDLARYSAIVLGIRAYNSRPAVRAVHDRLMGYVEKGGTLVVQYNTTSRFAPLVGPIGPFPLEISNGRVTDENATMTAVDPAHPMLNAPNKIGPADFAGWVQERGIYFAKTWDPRYAPLLQAADPEEEPQLGGTLVAKHGKGRYVYTGLAFFRQTRAGVPGSYRLFLNFLADP